MGVIWPLGAALWGFAEATLFFVVPDVFLTQAAIRLGFPRAAALSLAAAIFAALGGLLLWLWGANDPNGARAALVMIPAIGPDLIAGAEREVAHDWALHLLIGAMTGVPYKIYAVEAGARHISPFLFAPATVLVRLPRFLLTAGAAAIGKEILQKLGHPKWIHPLWAATWIIVYAIYWGSRFSHA